MGYRKQKKTYNLVFKDPELAGLEVELKTLSVGDTIKVMDSTGDHENPANIGVMLSIFAKSLVKWNLEEEDGTPVPATEEGVTSQDLDFIANIIAAWIDALVGVKPNLEDVSNSGENSPEDLTMLGNLSQSLAS